MISFNVTIRLRFGAAVFALFVLVSSHANAQILSSKRGLADNNATYDGLQATGATWYYTWGTSPDNPGNFDATHFPMFWNAPTQSTIGTVKNRNPQFVLGFNEPERSDQANMTVDQALASWSAISNAFAGTSTRLISPGVSDTVDSGNTIGGRTWLSNFMTQLNARKTDPQNPNYNPNLRVDAIAFHWYGASTPNDPAGAASSFLGSVDLYHNTYGLPVYITEFAIHDWGNAYTDAQIIEANREFLNIVIPALESRSYVAGYSWFNGFSDSHLYGGSPPTPTPMSYSYIGAVGAGQVANIGGQDLGEHVAYLTGGELTMTGAAPGTVRYVNALAGTSTISGSLDWGLSAVSNWVRILPGATLQKAGSNQITFGAGTLTNNGTLEVAQGSLRLAVPATGNGGARVTGGTLALTGSGRLDSAPLIDVQSGGTLDVSAVSSAFSVHSGQMLNADGTIVGNVTAATGSTVAGGGVIGGNLSAQSGSAVRVGKDGSGVPHRFVIDNFESYSLGDVRTVASPPWTAHQDTSLADIESYNGSKVLTLGSSVTNNFTGVSRSLADANVIDNNATSTLFFRLNSKTGSPNHSVGLGDQASTATVDFSDFETQLRVKQGTNSGTIALDARNGSSFSATLANNLAVNTWYNIWMVVNQTSDKYDIYMNTGTGAATSANKLNPSPLSFRNGTISDLNTLLAFSGSAPIDNGVRLDDFVFLTGIDLTNPAAGFDPGLTWSPETLTVNGNYTQNSGATLQLNLFDPSHRDALHISGQANFGGILDVSFAVGAPAPHLGDIFDILDFVSASGAFATLNLPALPTDFAWDTSNLLTNGVLKIGMSGDFNGDGAVDAADYVVWRQGLGTLYTQTDYDVWRAHFGQTAGSGSGAIANAAVPEPITSLRMLIVGMLAMSSNRRRKG